MVSLLAALLEKPTDETYGFDLARRAKLSHGTIYPALARLERAQWVTSRWEDLDSSSEGRPRRRLYLLTGEGEASARAQMLELEARLSRVRLGVEGAPSRRRTGTSPA